MTCNSRKDRRSAVLDVTSYDESIPAFAPAGAACRRFVLRIYSLFWMSVMAAVARIPKTASPGIPFLMHMRYLTGANGISE